MTDDHQVCGHKGTGVFMPQTRAPNTSNPEPKPPSRRPVTAAPRATRPTAASESAAAAAGVSRAGDAVGPQVGGGVRGAAVRGAAAPRQAGLRHHTAHQELVPPAAIATVRSQVPCSGVSPPTCGAAEGGSTRHMLAPPSSTAAEPLGLAPPVHLDRFGSCRLPTASGPGCALLDLHMGCADALVAPPPGTSARARRLSYSDSSLWGSPLSPIGSSASVWSADAGVGAWSAPAGLADPAGVCDALSHGRGHAAGSPGSFSARLPHGPAASGVPHSAPLPSWLLPHRPAAIGGPHSAPLPSGLHAPIAAGGPGCATGSFGRGGAPTGALGTMQQQPLWLPRQHSGSGGVSCAASAPMLQPRQGAQPACELGAEPWGLPLRDVPNHAAAGVARATSLCSGLQPHVIVEDVVGNDNSDLEARLDSQLLDLLQQRQHMLLKRAAAGVASSPTIPGMAAPALAAVVPCGSQPASGDGLGPLLGDAGGVGAQLLGAALPPPVAPPPLSSTAARAAAQAKLEQLATVKQMQEVLELELLQLLS